MKKIDLIIDVLEGYFDNRPLGLDKMHKAIAAARELRALKPVAVRNKSASAYMEFSSIESWDSGIPTSATLLYALDDEVTK